MQLNSSLSDLFFLWAILFYTGKQTLSYHILYVNVKMETIFCYCSLKKQLDYSLLEQHAPFKIEIFYLRSGDCVCCMAFNVHYYNMSHTRKKEIGLTLLLKL